LVRFGDVNVANKGCTTSRCNKAIIPEMNAVFHTRYDDTRPT